MNKFGLTPSQVSEIQSIFRSILPANQNAQIWIYGSRSRGDFKPYSDIDLLIESISPSRSVERNRLVDAFEDSELPFKIDLVLSEDLFPPFKANIDREKVLFLEI